MVKTQIKPHGITPIHRTPLYLVLLLITVTFSWADTPLNTLTPEETQAGWKLLWDGQTMHGWVSARSPDSPMIGWHIKDGLLVDEEKGGGQTPKGGDIMTADKYSNFDLKLDFKITPGANSGIKIFVNPEINKGSGFGVGLEYQILDDLHHPDAKHGKNGDRTMAALYDLIPPAVDKKVNPIGEWNHAEIISEGHHVENWLNGQKVLEYDRGSEEFRKLVAASKYHDYPNFGELPEGPILLQDHGNEVSFTNIKIKILPAP